VIVIIFLIITIVFLASGGQISLKGETQQALPNVKSDIVLVALGQVKQESWINRYWHQVPGQVYIGVGGAIDYLSGQVRRAPVWIRNLRLEWLYRLITQPWRITRQFKIAQLVLELLFSRRTLR
jgi:N-acetylglucosaminyldiphosphoundecaprenol N-acetyl-beta-D-mannosaminyltransferase